MSSDDGRRSRVAILTHMVTPYRVPLFEHLAQHFDVVVFYSGHESNRVEWHGVERELKQARVKRSRGVTIRYWKRRNGTPFDAGFFHITPGFLSDLMRSRPDALISTEMGFRTFVALLYAAVYNKPVWIWWGGTAHNARSIGLLRKLFRRVVARWARRWISYGRSSTEYLLSLGVQRREILQIQNCVDERAYAAPAEPAFHLATRPVLLHVGRMVPLKGIDLLLETAKSLQVEGLRFSTLLVGDGPERKALEEQVGRLALRDVHFAGSVPAARMPSVYRSADLLVFPSLRDVWGLVVNEAMWAGLPVLASLYAGCASELLPPECIFDPFDADEFTVKLRKGLQGALSAPDLSRLKTSTEVASLVVDELRRALRTMPSADAIPTSR
jgi:glycosyltransferase involved in cell wall biosynthesis